MNKEKFKIFLAAFITLLLGPGAGHLLLKQWKKAIIFISTALGLFIILGINFISEIGTDIINSIIALEPTERFKQVSDLYLKFQDNNSKMMLFFDVCFAAVWAYSIVDIFISSRKSIKEEEQQQEKGQEK